MIEYVKLQLNVMKQLLSAIFRYRSTYRIQIALQI